jgi:magnesium chelatase subunit I
MDQFRELLTAFDEGTIVHAGDDIPSASYVEVLTQLPALRAPIMMLTGGEESPAAIASAVEFALEGLHLSKRLNKESVRGKSAYRGRS